VISFPELAGHTADCVLGRQARDTLSSIARSARRSLSRRAMTCGRGAPEVVEAVDAKACLCLECHGLPKLVSFAGERPASLRSPCD
jgi:hypothetical protein